MDASRVLHGYTPLQARIGVGRNAGHYSLEENFLLIDGFYLLVNSERAWKHLNSLGKMINDSVKGGYPSEDAYRKVSAVNHNVCLFARNSIVNLYSFVECFVNSIGYDFYLRNKNRLSVAQQDILQGKKGGFLSLEYKLEKFPLIISPQTKQSIYTIDNKQRRKPFVNFLNEYKELRDAAMHYSPLKAVILQKPAEWVKKAKIHSELVIEVAQLFWLACYPQQPFPFYVKGLDYSKCYEEGEHRYDSMEFPYK